MLPVLPPALDAALQQALAAHRAGQGEAAEAVYRQVLDACPTHAEARHLLAVRLLQSGRAAEAEQEIRRAIEDGKGAFARHFNTLGNILAATGQPQKALEAFGRAEKADPKLADAPFNRGTILLGLDRPQEAMQAFQKTLALAPGHLGALNNLGGALVKQGRMADAIALYQRAQTAGVPLAAIGPNLANALELANRLDEAHAIIDSLLAASPAPLPAALLVIRGRLRRRQGDLSGALADLDSALSQPLGDPDRIEALHNKGLTLDQQGEASAAFAAFAACNALVAAQPATLRHDGAAYFDSIERTRQWFNADRLGKMARRAQTIEAGENVVFFVGFPRSGTTLMEQILEAHPRLVTTMESSPLENVRQNLGLSYPEVVERLDGPAGHRLRQAFFAAAEAVTGPLDDRIVVDKLPLNIVNLGLAQALFPQARVLLALRDPRDCVLSCFMQNFRPNPAMVNFLDLTQTARTYQAVMGLWQHFQQHLVLPMHSYRYEDLIGDFNGTVRGVLDFIGVEWDDAIEKYREKASRRDIVTPSYRDVTAPLFTRAMARWKQYEADLAPVLPTLAPFVSAFGYQDAVE
ncbi:tetratricopeptide repeat-containing sulfotransferase family protein [Insolitispirillum peregrinum]|uniref:Tfp pilus assembly protein PilF n=1 Tax=Insolitispirillum peregrinum TaxID=80876 RepID=A0A1N7JGX9_9PROT|nr:tetratricopeptide repeat-containing sulfotransferase family protein [Insolitispirillum peregrinum]SIS48570.1 Tfp pilus assembly protein PilF [Insolitispirillum peregrinum]